MNDLASTTPTPRLLLVGGGHAMLPSIMAARAWTERGAAVTLVNDHRYLYYSGMVPEYLGGVYTRDEVRIDLEVLCARVGIPFLEARVARLDPTAKMLFTDGSDRLPYDLVAFDVGAHNPSVPGGAVPTKPLHHVEHLAQRLRDALQQPPQPFRLVIAGGGAAGVEVALNVSSRFARHGRPDHLALHLVERGDRLLPGFPARMRAYLTDLLTRRGVQIRLHTRVCEATAGIVRLDPQATLPVDATLWATGSVGQPFFRDAGLPCDAQGFVRVNAALQSLSDPRLFAAGDCATVHAASPLARIGVHAVKQGPVLRDNLTRALDALADGALPDAGALGAFKPYPVAPLILSTGTPDAVWVAGSWWMHGKPMLRLKHYVDRRWIRPYGLDAWGDAGLRRLLAADAAHA